MSRFLEGRIQAEIDGVRWLLAPHEMIESHLLAGGLWEPEVVAAFARVVRPGHVVFDIGANVGVHTLRLSRMVGESGRVIACEPMREPAAVCAFHLALNGIRNTQLLHYAAGDQDADALPEIGAHYSCPVSGDGGLYRHPTDMRRLDTMVAAAGIDRLDLVKIDVDGMELRIVTAAERTLRRFRPALIVEVCDANYRQYALAPAGLSERPYGDYVRELFDFLHACGYRIYDLQPGPVLTTAQAVAARTTAGTANIFACVES